MLHSVIACNPPKIVSVTRSPETPNYDQSVTIEAQVIPEADDIESVILRYTLNCANWINVTMSLEDPEDGIYVADIPSQPYGTTVCYKVYAYDVQGRYSRSDYYDYVVCDFVPPVISDVLQVPTSPLPYETVTVSANVTEPPEASGVKNVTLWYTTDDVWSFLDMVMQDGLWTAAIPGQSEGVNVRFFVEAFDNAGNSATTSIFDYTVIIPNDPPVADFSESASTVYTGEVIYFDASGSYDPDGYIASYFWDFGDGNTGNAVTVEHAYVDDGSYNVTLTVTDNEGATNSAHATKTVLNRQPVASFTESAETVYVDDVISFNASESYDPDGTIVSYHWDFGDGNTGNGVSVQHAYSQEGTYTVTLTVTDDDGAIGTVNATKTVLPEIIPNQNPVASFTESAEIVYIGESIFFDSSGSYDPDGYIVLYHWDFGDGNTGNGVTIQHAYSQEGTYTVTLTVTDDDGATDADSATKTVLTPIIPNKKPVASFTESDEIVYTGESIYFAASGSYDTDGYIVSYHWDFGDGNTATGVTVHHAYADDGSYSVTLTVTDNEGATDTDHATKTVLNRQPVASFTETAGVVYTSETISFNASGSYDTDGTIVSYHWDFGDGNTGTGVSVNHSYPESGTYTVTLTVTDDDGATDTANATKTVLTPIIPNKKPVASFTESDEIVHTGESIFFDSSGSYDTDGTIIAHLWDFGDEDTAVGVEVDHAYEDDGTYTVTLTVIDNNGATDSSTSTKNVLNRPPLALFTENATTVSTGEVIHFDASGSYDTDGYIVSYHWDFGDENTTTGVTSFHAYSEDGNYTVTLTVTDDDGASTSESAMKIVETEEEMSNGVLSLSFLAAIGLGVAALTVTLLYGLFIRRKKKGRTDIFSYLSH